MSLSQALAHHFRSIAPAALVLLTPSHALATIPDYDYQWATIGDPGNRDWNEDEAPVQAKVGIFRGGVDYEFRLAKTEVTLSQWFEFVEAYLPYAEVNTFSVPAFGGQYIQFAPDGSGAAMNGPPNAPTNMGWEYAARYANWLHNGKVKEQWAFESGAYDTSTFTQNPDGTWNHQLTRSPGARFWIPSIDEWIKAGYWDPNKNDGEGGYWQYIGGADVPLQPGQPEEGGMTNAGNPVIYGPMPIDVASYPEIGPWGLHDMSGGEEEWLEDAGFNPADRLFSGSHWHASNDLRDQLTVVLSSPVSLAIPGLRIASAIPSSGAGLFFVMSVFIVGKRKRCLKC